MVEVNGDEDALEMVELTVTCDTSGCQNAGIDIVVSAGVGGNVICGPCSIVLVETVVGPDV